MLQLKMYWFRINAVLSCDGNYAGYGSCDDNIRQTSGALLGRENNSSFLVKLTSELHGWSNKIWKISMTLECSKKYLIVFITFLLWSVAKLKYFVCLTRSDDRLFSWLCCLMSVLVIMLFDVCSRDYVVWCLFSWLCCLMSVLVIMLFDVCSRDYVVWCPFSWLCCLCLWY